VQKTGSAPSDAGPIVLGRDPFEFIDHHTASDSSKTDYALRLFQPTLAVLVLVILVGIPFEIGAAAGGIMSLALRAMVVVSLIGVGCTQQQNPNTEYGPTAIVGDSSGDTNTSGDANTSGDLDHTMCIAGIDGLAAAICTRLVTDGYATRCGLDETPCEEEEEGCLWLGFPSTQPSAQCITAGHIDPPIDLAALFAALPFLPPEAQEAITETGTFEWGDPTVEGTPHLEITVADGDFDIDSGQSGEPVPSAEYDREDSVYIEAAKPLLPYMGIHPMQTRTLVNKTGVSQGGGGTSIASASVRVYRVINGIGTHDDQMVIKFRADNGELSEIWGDWTPINYGESQLATDLSVREIIDALMQRLLEKELTSVSGISLSYAVKQNANDEYYFDLNLSFLSGRSIFEVDI